jgi:hypothetical protein
MRQCVARAEELTRGLDHRAFNWRLRSETWSIGQCLEHLSLINEADFPNLDACIAEAKNRGWRHPGPYNYGPLTRWFIWTIEPPAGARFPTLAKYMPAPADLSMEATVQRYRDVAQGVIARMEAADGLDLIKARTALPALPQLQMPLGGRFALLAAHDRRHLWQAEKVRQQPVFPG